MRTRYDEYSRALEHELGRIQIDPDADAAAVADQIAQAEQAARHAVAARWLDEARSARDAARQRGTREADRQALDDRAAKQARKQLRRVDGGDTVDLAGRYHLLTHPDGAVAVERDPLEEDFGVGWQPPVVAGVRCGIRYARGVELAAVENLLAVLSDHRQARARLDLAAAERAKRLRPREPAGAITED
jgi:hypothetical protein